MFTPRLPLVERKQSANHLLSAIAMCGALVFAPLAAYASEPAATSLNTMAARKVENFAIESQPLIDALNQFADQTGIAFAYKIADLQSKQSSRVVGRYDIRTGLGRLLTGTGVVAQFVDDKTISLVLAGTDGATTLPPVRVSGDAVEFARGPVDGYIAKRSATGTKTDTPLAETPQSISVITSDRVEAIGATSLKEALSYTPGINTSPWGNDSQYDWVYLRGFDAYSPGFFMDGMQLRNSGSWAVWQTENYGVERIEYLRGPSSVLYGQNSAGGLINVVNKLPTREAIREIQLQAGSHNRKQIAADLSGAADSDENWLYRLTLLGRDAELSVGENLANDRIYIAPAVTWEPSGDTRITFLSQYMDMDVASNWSSYPVQGTLTSNPNGTIPTSTFLGEPDFSRYDQEQWMAGWQIEHNMNNNWVLRQNARYGKFDTDYQTFYSARFVTVNEDNPGAAENFRWLARTPFGSYESVRQYTLDNQAEVTWNAGRWEHTLLVGLDYQKTDFDVTTFWGGLVDPIDAFNPVYGANVTLVTNPFLDSVSELSQTGLYIQDQIKFDKRWVVAVSGRFDHAVIDSDNQLLNAKSDQSDDNFAGRIGLVYLADKGFAPYVSYSESFSPITTIDPETSKPFDPETGRQYEFGMRYQPVGKNDAYSVAVFEIERKNYVTNDVSFIPRNVGEVIVRGVELEGILEPLPNMNLTLSYSWTPDADITASANPNDIGKRSFNYAEHQGSLWSDYRFNHGFQVGVGARYTGSSLGASEAAPDTIPSYVLLDALVGYEFNSWHLSINARNLADKEYVANCNGSGSRCSYGETRTVIGTLTYNW